MLRGEAAQIWASIIKPLILPGMDEGTLKTPIPKCRLYWSFLFGVVRQFCRFRIWSETECKTPAEYGLQQGGGIHGEAHRAEYGTISG